MQNLCINYNSATAQIMKEACRIANTIFYKNNACSQKAKDRGLSPMKNKQSIYELAIPEEQLQLQNELVSEQKLNPDVKSSSLSEPLDIEHSEVESYLNCFEMKLRKPNLDLEHLKIPQTQSHTQSTCEPPMAYDHESIDDIIFDFKGHEDSTITSIHEIFKRDGILGEGTYGTVYRATHKQTGEVVALKKLHWDSQSDGIPATSVREVIILKGLSHPNIVQLKKIHYEAKNLKKATPKLFLEFEYLELDLRKKTFPQRQIPLVSVKNIMYQILRGLAYCHNLRIIHRDIKPNNVLICFPSKKRIKSQNSKQPTISRQTSKRSVSLEENVRSCISENVDTMKTDSNSSILSSKSCEDIKREKILASSIKCTSKSVTSCSSSKKRSAASDNLVIKIADFGLARVIPFPLRQLTREVVTLWYRAPEILLGLLNYTPAIDIWASGCLFAELLYGRAIFSGDVEIDTLFKIFQLLGTPDENIWEGVSKLPYYKNAWPKWPRRSDRFDYFRDNLDAAAKDLLDKLLTYNPSCRITATEALKHEWFDSIRKFKVSE